MSSGKKLSLVKNNTWVVTQEMLYLTTCKFYLPLCARDENRFCRLLKGSWEPNHSYVQNDNEYIVTRFLVHLSRLALTFHILDFSSETTQRNSTILDWKPDLNVLYQVCVFCADRKNKMAAPTSDWLRHFRLLHWHCCTEFSETWQKVRSQCPLPSFCFFWLIKNKTKMVAVADLSKRWHIVLRCTIWPLVIFFIKKCWLNQVIAEWWF